MTSILCSYDVDSPELKKPFRLDVVDGIEPAAIDYIEKEWRPVIERPYKSALLQYFLLPKASQTNDAFREILGRLGIPDRHWDWRNKCNIAPGSNRRLYALMNDVHVEGIAMLLFGRESRTHSPGLPVVYVDYLSAAPWNRVAIQRPPRFSGIGTMLLEVAVLVSRMQNCEGRCALHSLPSADSFYLEKGMKAFGIDSGYHNLTYFEFDELAARAFKS